MKTSDNFIRTYFRNGGSRKKSRILPFDSRVMRLSAVKQALNSALQGCKALGAGTRF